MRAWTDATWAIVRRDAILYGSYRARLLSQFVSPLFSIAIFYYISHLFTKSAFHSPGGYFGFVVVGLAIIQVLATSMGSTPGSVRQELVAGTIERYLVSAHGAVSGIIAMMIFPLCTALLGSVIVLAIATAIFELPLAATAPLAIPVGLLGALAFAPFALALSASVILVKQTASSGQFIIAGLSIVGGLYFPVRLLPGWIRWTSEIQPFTPAVDLLRHLLVGAQLTHSEALDLGKLAGFAIALLPLSALLLRIAIRRAQATGTIVEY